MKTDADVIVVGAGPAGSVTALLLARAGVRVLVLDRHAFPRAKPCGDCLSADASAVLRRLGLLDRVHALPHARLTGWRIVAPDGTAFSSHFAAAPYGPVASHALAVERTHLDAGLLDAAVAAGAAFLPNVHVRDLLRADRGRVAGVLADGVPLRARCVVGADGLRSIVATRLRVVRRAARLRKVSLTARLYAPGLTDGVGEMHIGDGIVAGVAPVAADGRCNVTVVADATRSGRTVAADPAGFAVAALQSLPELRDRAAWAVLRDTPLTTSGPFDRPVRRVIHDGCALVGDAAGYYDPFTGQGIHQALRSAELLAGALLPALERAHFDRRALRPYALHRRQLTRASSALQHVIEAIVSRPRLACHAVARLAHAHAFADALLGVTAGLHGPARLLSPRALSSLLAHESSPEQIDDDNRRALHRRARAGLLPRRG